MTLKIVPITFDQMNAFIKKHHRHHKPVRGHKFSLACSDGERIVGVAAIGRPVARGSDDGLTMEVTRLCTDGTANACSKLYGAAAKISKIMGYKKIQTYLLIDESAVSIKAAGWKFECFTNGGKWNYTDGAIRRDDQPTVVKQRWALQLL